MSTVVRPALLVAACYGAMTSLAIAINLVPVFLPAIRGQFGDGVALTQEELGRLAAIAFAGLVIGIVVTGPLADRFGAKPFALLGDLLIAAGLAAMASAERYLGLGVAVFVMGFGAGVLDMVLSPVVAALAPERRSAAMNWLHSFYCVGAALTILVATVAPWAGLGLRGTCLVLAPLPLLLLVLFATLRFPPLVAAGGRTPFSALARDGWFIGALLAILLGGATELGLAQWLPYYAERTLGYPAWIGGGALLAFSLAMAAGRMVVAAAGPRLDPYRTMAVACVASAALFPAAAWLASPAAALACCVAAGFAGSCLWPTMLAVAADRRPDGGASMFGALAAFGNAGGIAMPWVVGAVADAAGLRAGIALSALAPAAMLPLVLLLARRR